MARVFIGIGSNVGDRGGTIARALNLLRERPGIEVRAVSPLIETEPVGGPPDQGRFLNGAAELATELEPEALLDELEAIEEQLGRRRTVRWGPRTIDLDVLLWDDRVIVGGRLQVPHPRMRGRRFVLEPLAQIASDVADPVTGWTVGELLKQLPSGQGGEPT
jgi:2-amino-4-hydroxy-6-hydroxymethyldihydropteridine diphosphokinase